jgi:hypothetical protein
LPETIVIELGSSTQENKRNTQGGPPHLSKEVGPPRHHDFLTTDGEKASRDRDGEFLLTEQDTRPNLLAAWERGWGVLFDTLAGLSDSDLEKSVTIRGESQTARQALLRGMSHVAYHTGQVLYLVRLWRPESPWLSIPPGQSRGVPGNYRQS